MGRSSGYSILLCAAQSYEKEGRFTDTDRKGQPVQPQKQDVSCIMCSEISRMWDFWDLGSMPWTWLGGDVGDVEKRKEAWAWKAIVLTRGVT
jgi:hypothetical protein